MTKTRFCCRAAAALLGLASGCGSVDVPRESFWRLELPAPAGGELPRAGCLRVADLQLGNALDGDCLLVADGPVSLEPIEMQRWVAPLDRLVTDAVVLGLSRTRMFTLVLGAGDPGREDHTLFGRIVDFAEHRRPGGDVALVVLEFWLGRSDAILFQEEFRAEVPLAGSGPEAMVSALSRGLQQVLDALVGRMRAAGVFAGAIQAAPAK
jgi:uncharacterized lipoprotein YmbA